jgi:eukaryotic-like serine/threonine-protein kinase
LPLGKRLGTYKILQTLGAGGMAEVYRAIRADDQYRQEVAIKLVRAGQDSGYVISHFKNERQILASLDHPNIARLLDGGTTDEGLPYFVMELIEGMAIDQYCNRNQLSIAERLKLFLQVCSAVQYAHQRLIIHRDIKPGNILVTPQGVPKLLDFGIAKILDVSAVAGNFEPTLTVFRVLTPGYASPEQVKGETITTASDIYCLGVVLYELLTGRHPYRRVDTTPQEIARAVCEDEPVRPSTAVRRRDDKQNGPASANPSLPSFSLHEGTTDKLSKRLRGDLDNIILMAMRKEPQRRYATVEQFAEDIRRHLNRLPVIARKDTVGYRASKFIVRHKAGAAAAATVAVVLRAALTVTVREARIARHQAEMAHLQRARAERRFNDVRKLARSMMFEIHDSIRDLAGATQARKLLVSRAREYLDSLSQEAGGDPSLQRELADAYDRVGDVLGYTGAADLGDYAGASQSYAKAVAIRESLAAANPSDVSLQTSLWGEYWKLAYVQKDEGDLAGARLTLQRALPVIKRLAGSGNDPGLQDWLGGVYWLTGMVLEKTDDFPAALRNYRMGAAIREPIATDRQPELMARTHLIADYNGIARSLAHTGQMDQALIMSSKAMAINQELTQAHPANSTLREFLAESYDVRGSLLAMKGDLPAALTLDRRMWKIFKQLADADPSNMLARSNVGWSDLSLGEILLRQGRTTQALRRFHDALTIFRAGVSPKELWFVTELGQSYSDMGMANAALAERATSSTEKARAWRAARSWFAKGLDTWSQRPMGMGMLDANGHDQTADLRRQLARCEANLTRLGLPTHD